MSSLRVSAFLAARSLARSNYGIAATTTLMMLLIYMSLLFLPSLIQGAIDRVNAQLVDTLTSNIVITPAGQAASIERRWPVPGQDPPGRRGRGRHGRLPRRHAGLIRG